jgi:hypothetical protein
VSYIHELITIIMAKREPNGSGKKSKKHPPFSNNALQHAGRISAAVLDFWTDLPLVSWRLRSLKYFACIAAFVNHGTRLEA